MSSKTALCLANSSFQYSSFQYQEHVYRRLVHGGEHVYDAVYVSVNAFVLFLPSDWFTRGLRERERVQSFRQIADHVNLFAELRHAGSENGVQKERSA